MSKESIWNLFSKYKNRIVENKHEYDAALSILKLPEKEARKILKKLIYKIEKRAAKIKKNYTKLKEKNNE